MIKRLVLMLQFLTKLPLPFEIKADDEDFQKGIVYFPLVGLVIGLMLYGLYRGVASLYPWYIACIFVVAFQVFITGGLHLDGLADSFDGLYSYRNKERMLEIMKDSRVGSNGVLVLWVALSLKLTLLIGLLDQGALWVLILMPVYGRFMGVFLAYIGVYARQKGMGGFFIGTTKLWHVCLAGLWTLLASLVHIKALSVLPVLLVLSLAYNGHVKAKIDGITGDILGAWIEMSEIIFLLGVWLI